MKISFLKSKIRSLRKYDLFKAVIDILLPDINNIGDYNPKMTYRKGDRVYYFNQINEVSRIIEALEDIQPSDSIDMSKWTVVSGNSLPNANLLKKIQVNENNTLMYEGTSLNNVHTSEVEPNMNERDLWFSFTRHINNSEPPSVKENTLIIKNMVVQDEQPDDNNYLWGDTEPQE